MPAGGGAPITVKTGIDAPATVSVDGARVYWVEGGPIGAIEGFGRIARATHDGMDETVVLEATGGGPFDVDATHLYFANGFTLKRVSIGGGKVERLAIADLPISDVATDGTHVYWTSAHTGTVQKMAVNGGPIVTLAPGSGSGHTLRLDGTHVYWIDSDQFIKRVPKSGGPPATVVGPGSVTDFVVHGSHIYLAEWDRARILRAPVGGGEVLELVTLETDQTRRLATDGRLVYWIDQLDLGTVPVGGGPPQYIVLGEIASSPYLASAVAVDDTVVYWTEVVDNVIKMATPK